MRKLIIFILVFCQLIGYSQDCPEGDLELNDQSQIDNFSILYPDCNCLDGNLRIEVSSVNQSIYLDSLYSINKINGDLIIYNSTFLLDLEGLNNIDSLLGSLDIRNNFSLMNVEGLNNLEFIGKRFIFKDNPRLTSFRGLENIKRIDGFFDITNNNSIVNFSGLDNVESIDGFFQVMENDKLKNFQGFNRVKWSDGNFHVKGNKQLKSFEGFDSLKVIGFSIQLSGNLKLDNFEGLKSLQKIDGSISLFEGNIKNLNGLELLDTLYGLHIQDQNLFTSLEALSNMTFLGDLNLRRLDSIESLNGLENLTYINGFLRFRDNGLLTDLSALSQVDSIRGDLWIENNPSLVSLDGLENINPLSIMEDVLADIPDLKISGNQKLDVCSLNNICEFISNDIGTYEISNNGQSCLNEDKVLDNCMMVATDFVDVNNINIYPNPVRNLMMIESTKKDILFIHDLQGRQILESELAVGQNAFELNHIDSGVYFINTLNSGRFKVIKL